MPNYLTNLYDFIHEAQKERGTASLYLCSKKSPEDMESQFAQVDRQIKTLGSLPRKQSSHIEPFLDAVHALPGKRKYVVARMIEPAEAMTFYTRNIIAPAIEIAQELAVFNPAYQPGKVSAFASFLQWKERVGLERALGTQLTDSDWSNTIEFKNRLNYILSKQEAYERMFLALADEESRKTVEDLKKSNPVFQKIEAMHRSLLHDSALTPSQAITAEEWFELFTSKMDVLHQMGKIMVGNLGITTKKAVAKADPSVESGVRAYMDTIRKLPLFTGLNAETLQDLLKHARIVSHNRGAMIFMQNEQASRFYIILQGWVKLFKGNADGQESVLQVMSVGDGLLETAIFNNTPYPANAQAVDNVKLLSIPASIIREKLRHNQELAINMLSAVSGRSQAMISQFEQLTLKTVTQRVGWFLLKLFLESGERTRNLKLPYDKSLIAAYLGMKPETFSRTLQALKEQGIDIERNSVSLPDVFALCDYCDTDLAAKCSRAGTAECPDPTCVN